MGGGDLCPDIVCHRRFADAVEQEKGKRTEAYRLMQHIGRCRGRHDDDGEFEGRWQRDEDEKRTEGIDQRVMKQVDGIAVFTKGFCSRSVTAVSIEPDATIPVSIPGCRKR